MQEKIPSPEQVGEEQAELFDEDELLDPDKDTKKLLEFIKEADARSERERKEKKEKEGKKRKKPLDSDRTG